MEPNVFDKVHDVDLKKTMEQSYIDYAMSVISARALPDARDGLKPVQRRVLFSMIELNNGPDKPHRKCARIVGDTMGKYHPHGDSSIYGALVNMAQDWSTRYPLVDGHGNFGSVDGDGAAAMRYTEARLSRISMEMLADINKNTVDFVPNFDETEKEPVVLPSRFPNLLVNGTSGIAVGMATNIPPHNLREVIAAVVRMIDNRVNEDRETSLEEIMEIIKGPDFPTGATILGKRGIEEAYRTGRAKIKVRAVTNIETMPNGKSRIIVTELPYMVNKARLIEKIAELVKEKKIDGKYKYFFYYSANPTTNKGKQIGVAVADSPTGPFTDLGKPIITSSPTGRGQQIDVDVFTDPVSGKSYLYWGNGYMAGAELNDDMLSIKEETTVVLTPKGGTLQTYAYREAPYVIYRKGIYYFFWSVDDTGSPNYHVVYGTAQSPLGPIEVAKEPIVLIQNPKEEIYGPAHNSILQVPGKDKWYIVYHRINKNHLNDGPGWHREVCIDRMEFNPDGTIKQVIPTP